MKLPCVLFYLSMVMMTRCTCVYDATEISVFSFRERRNARAAATTVYYTNSSDGQHTFGRDVSEVSAERLPLAQSLRAQVLKVLVAAAAAVLCLVPGM